MASLEGVENGVHRRATRTNAVKESLERAAALAAKLRSAPTDADAQEELRRALFRAEREAVLEEECVAVERRALREAMLDDLVLRHAHCSSVLDRHRIMCDSKDVAAANEGATGGPSSASLQSLFDRAVASTNAIEAALRELRPNVPPAAVPGTIEMLQSM